MRELKFYRCTIQYYDISNEQWIYSVGQICAFYPEEKFLHFNEHFEEIKL